MAVMRADEAKDFYEEDEDPARVFARFDAAERQGKLRRTAPPSPPVPLRALLNALTAELRREGRELQIRVRLAGVLERLARAVRPHNRVS